MDHLPANQHLLEFLFQEYEEETQILLEELSKFYQEFPWDETVLSPNLLTIDKKIEDEDVDNSFNRRGDKIEFYRTVFVITAHFLD